LLLSLLATTNGSLWAQATAQIAGTVQRSKWRGVARCGRTATQTDTAVMRTAITNETGSYVLSNLPIGPYRIEAALPGFRTFVQTGIVLEVNSSPVINAVLQVGQVSEQVEVQANAALVETRSVGVGQVIENARILDLPLNGGNRVKVLRRSSVLLQPNRWNGPQDQSAS
jgi:carboxypeptidase family protein